MASIPQWLRLARRSAAGVAAVVVVVGIGAVAIASHRPAAVPGGHPASVISVATASPSPTPDDGLTHLTYSGAVAGVMVNPVVTCYGLTDPPSQASIVVWGTVGGEHRVIMIPSFLGELADVGINEGPIGPNPGTPLRLTYRAEPGGRLFPLVEGWRGDPSPRAYGVASHGDGTGTPGLSHLDWSTGVMIDTDLYAVAQLAGPTPTGPVALHIRGRVVCPGAHATTQPTPGVAPSAPPTATPTSLPTPLSTATPLPDPSATASPSPAVTHTAPASASPS